MHEHPTVQAIIKKKWSYLALMRKYAGTTVKQVFNFWKTLLRFRQTRTAANKASRGARRAKYEELLQDAERYASQHNMHQMFKLIRRLAPKQKYKKVQIYAENGQVLSKRAEAMAICEHFQAVFRGPEVPIPTRGRAASAPFTYEEIFSALQHIPMTKATPQHYAPGACWRAAAKGLAALLHACLHTCLHASPPQVPQHWKDGWLALLGKPAKCGRRPGDFRPICLQDPVGKALIQILANRLQPLVQQYATTCPQHAYLPHRSTEGALLELFRTCRMIRARCQEAVPNIQNKRFRQHKGTHTGGFILSLDMSNAFDIVPRIHIYHSLQEAGVQEGDIALIMEWLSGSQYHFRHGPHSHSVTTNRGVRQGCVLSPLLWACLTCYILKRLPPSIDIHDVQAYADDFVLTRCFYTADEFQASLRTIPDLLQHLRSYGLKINTSKTVLLIRMATPTGKAASKKYLLQTKRGTCFRVPGFSTEYIPVKTKHVYLGCVISLFNFEADTVRHRIQAGRTQFQRLKPILGSQRYMSVGRRIRLWSTCVWATISYGLVCCGLPSSSLTAFQRVINLQLRSIAKLPSHITHVSNAELYQRLHVLPPEIRLQQLSTHLCERLTGLQRTMTQTDVMCRPQLLDQARHASELIAESAGHVTQLQRVSQDERQPCPHCGLYFQGITAVKIHVRRMHNEAAVPPPAIQTAVDRYNLGVDGMPTCRRCGHVFGAWKDLVNHVTRNQCHGPATMVAQQNEPLPLSQRHALIQTWLVHGAVGLERQLTSELRDELLQRCCLCRQWIASPSHIKAHLRRSHPEVYHQHADGIAAQCGLLSSVLRDPCPFCLQQVSCKHKDRHATRCPVLLQVSLCCWHHGGHGPGRNRLTLRGTAASVSGQSTAGTSAATSSAGQQHQCSSHPGRGRRQSSSPKMAEAQRQGRTETATVEQIKGNLLGWMAGRKEQPAAGQPTGDHEHVDPTLLEAGGRHQRVENGQGLPSPVSYSGARDGRAHAVRGSHGLAPEEGQRCRRPSPENRPPEEPSLGAKTRLDHLVSTTEQVERMSKMGWVKPNDGKLPSSLPLVYNPETKEEVPHKGLGPMEHQDALKALDTLLTHLNGQIMQRFHSTRPLAAQYKGEMLAFMLEISCRGMEAQQVYEALTSLCHLSAWFAIGARLRLETPKRSPLATRLQQMLPRSSATWLSTTPLITATNIQL